MNEILYTIFCVIYLIFLDDYKLVVRLFILGIMDNHLKMIESPKSKWFNYEEDK